MERGHQKSTCGNNFGPCSLIIMLVVLQCHALTRLEAATGPWLSSTSETPTVTSSPYAVNVTNSSLWEITCPPGDVPHSGKQFCCNRCNPGYRMAEECSGPGKTSKCEECEEGTFMETANYFHNCRECYRCKANEEEVSMCRPEENRVCKCKTGYYKHKMGAFDHVCHPKKTCGAGEREKESFKEDQDRECECKDDHYRVNSTTCKRCDECSKECSHLCTPVPTIKRPVTDISEFPSLTVAVLVAAVVTTVPVGLVFYTAFKHRWKLDKKFLHKSDLDDSTYVSGTSSESLHITTFERSNKDIESVPMPTQDHSGSQEELFNCISQEIKTNKFIYSVLEVVPVGRVTELVRLLGMKDQDIERARRDNSISCHEAHYHMLKLWSDRGTRGRSTTLPWPLLPELLETLRDMGLGGCAESLVDEYGLEQA